MQINTGGVGGLDRARPPFNQHSGFKMTKLSMNDNAKVFWQLELFMAIILMIFNRFSDMSCEE